MITRPDRRHVARLTIPSPLSRLGLEGQEIRLVDLSPAGARLEHRHPLHSGLLCVVDLPPALGRGTLSGRIVWSRLHRIEHSLEGTQRRYFQSGLTWTGVTPEQLGALTAALDLLQPARGRASMRTRRVLSHPPEGPPLWMRIYVQQVGATWAAMIVADGERPPEPGSVKGLVFFGDTPEEAERLAVASLGEGRAQN